MLWLNPESGTTLKHPVADASNVSPNLSAQTQCWPLQGNRALFRKIQMAVSPRDSHEILSTIGGRVHDLQIFL